MFIYATMILIATNIGSILFGIALKMYPYIKRAYKHWRYRKSQIIKTKIKWADPLFTTEMRSDLQILLDTISMCTEVILDN